MNVTDLLKWFWVSEQRYKFSMASHQGQCIHSFHTMLISALLPSQNERIHSLSIVNMIKSKCYKIMHSIKYGNLIQNTV